MPSIGFGDEEKKELTEEQIEQRSEEIKKAQSAKPERDHIKFSQKRLDKLRSIYSEVVVHDYGDSYHKSKEELKDENQFYELFQEINGKKRNYRRLPEYIIAYRHCLNFLHAVAAKQDVYSEEEFVDLYFRGKIHVTGMYIPAYKGKDRKRISQEALMEYILSDGDPNEFIEKDPLPEITSKEELDEMRARVFSPEQYKRMIESAFIDDYQDVEDTMIDPDSPKTYEDKPVAMDLTKEEQKKIFSKNPGLSMIVKEVADRAERSQVRGYSSEYVFDFESDDLATFDKYNRVYGVKDMDEVPEFHGSVQSKKDFKNYLRDIEEWEFRNIRVKVDGRYRTLEEQNDADAKAALDQAGYNIRMFWNNQERDREVKKYLKTAKQKEKELRKRLSTMESLGKTTDPDGRERNLSDSERYERWKQFEKDQKKKEKRKSKPSKKDKKATKVLKNGVKKKKRKVDDFLLGVSGNGNKSMKEYKKENLDFTSKGFKHFQIREDK